MKPLYIKSTITWILIFLIYSISSSLYAQNKTLKVTGTVYDESGITLPSVTITVKGQKGVGVLSDNDGKFTISVPEGATLVFSFVGMITRSNCKRKTNSLQSHIARRFQILGRSRCYWISDLKKT